MNIKIIFQLMIILVFIFNNVEAGVRSEAETYLSENNSWKFAVISDVHSSLGYSGYDKYDVQIVNRSLYHAIVAEGVDLVVITGDLNIDPDHYYYNFAHDTVNLKAFLTNIGTIFSDARIPVYVIRGNHDAERNGSVALWQKTFNYLPDNGPAKEKYMTYSFTHKNATFIMLDDYSQSWFVPVALTEPWVFPPIDNRCQDPIAVNQTWLKTQLSKNKNPHVFVFKHQPVMQIDNYGVYCMPETDAQSLWEILVQNKVGALFCGHHHRANISQITGGGYSWHPYQIICGTSSSPTNEIAKNKSSTNSPYFANILYDSRNRGESPIGYVLVTISGASDAPSDKTVQITWKSVCTSSGLCSNPSIRYSISYTVP